MRVAGVGVGQLADGVGRVGPSGRSDRAWHRDPGCSEGGLGGLGTATDYTKQWAHLDGFLAVEDAAQRDGLNAELEKRLRDGQLDGVSLDPPPDVESFAHVWFGARAEPDEFTLKAAVGGWRSELGHLLAKKVPFDNGPTMKEYRLRDLLTAQIDRDGDTFLFDQGDW